MLDKFSLEYQYKSYNKLGTSHSLFEPQTMLYFEYFLPKQAESLVNEEKIKYKYCSCAEKWNVKVDLLALQAIVQHCSLIVTCRLLHSTNFSVWHETYVETARGCPVYDTGVLSLKKIIKTLFFPKDKSPIILFIMSINKFDVNVSFEWNIRNNYNSH